MIIYIVKTGDTIDGIANKYGISVSKLITDNNLTDPNHLVPGEVVIIVNPSKTYTVKDGDSLKTIAEINQVSINELLRNNPYLSDATYIYPGEVLTVGYNRTSKISTHGYTNTFIDRHILRKTLPYLTYLSIFNYRIVENGDVLGSDDDIDIIQMSKEYSVIPIMHLATLTVQGKIDFQITYQILTDEQLQDKLFEKVIQILKNKGYYGVNISAQYINSANQNLFNNYTKKLSERLREEGLLTFITINPKIDNVDNKVIYEDINYTSIGSTVDSVVFMQYRWSLSNTPPAPLVSINNLNVFLDYAITQIQREKIITGVPTIGYLWELPYATGYSNSNSLSLDNAIILARSVGAIINFDDSSQTPYFTYKNGNNIEYIVWFINAVTMDSLIKLLLEKGINGTGVWNIMNYFTHLWLVINCQYEIIKLLPEI